MDVCKLRNHLYIKCKNEHSGPFLSGPLCQEDFFSHKLVISIQFDLCNLDTSQLRTAFVSPKGVFNREVLGSSVFENLNRM
jgi:hypothetical protein